MQAIRTNIILLPYKSLIDGEKGNFFEKYWMEFSTRAFFFNGEEGNFFEKYWMKFLTGAFLCNIYIYIIYFLSISHNFQNTINWYNWMKFSVEAFFMKKTIICFLSLSHIFQNSQKLTSIFGWGILYKESIICFLFLSHNFEKHN